MSDATQQAGNAISMAAYQGDLVLARAAAAASYVTGTSINLDGGASGVLQHNWIPGGAS
jgi:hypothetical protein